MNKEILESLGLSPNEAKIYETLIERGELSIGDISNFSRIHRRNVYDTVQRLIQKGLCFSVIYSHETKYQAVDPDKLLELIAEKREGLEKVLPDLRKKFRESRGDEEVYIYRGLEGQKNVWRDVLRVGKDSYFIGAKGTWFDPRLEQSRIAFFKEANRKKIKFIQIFDSFVKEKDPQFTKNFPGQLTFRFLPKKYTTDSAIHIFGDYVVTYSGLTMKLLDENVVFFVIHSKTLADSYRTWFAHMWDGAETK